MEVLKYRVIKSRAQYDEYCNLLEQLAFQEDSSSEVEEEMELLTVLIEKYDKENSSFENADPIEVLKSLMVDHQLKAKDLVEILGVSKGLVSEILSYKKGLSKEVIRKLAQYFGMNQEAFNRPYQLDVDNRSISKSKKESKVLTID